MSSKVELLKRVQPYSIQTQEYVSLHYNIRPDKYEWKCNLTWTCPCLALCNLSRTCPYLALGGKEDPVELYSNPTL